MQKEGIRFAGMYANRTGLHFVFSIFFAALRVLGTSGAAGGIYALVFFREIRNQNFFQLSVYRCRFGVV